MMKITLLLALFALVAAQCGTDELACGVYCYNPTQYSCTQDPLSLNLQLCAAGTSPCGGACIADCGYFCNNVTGQAEPNDDDELVCPPDCSAQDGFGACGNECIDTSAFCCISETKVPTASCPFAASAAPASSASCPFNIDATGQLWDGQLRLSFGPGAFPAFFNLTNGVLVDNRGQICYISQGYQLQCNTPPQTTDVPFFGLSNGFLTHNGSAQFYQCPVGTGGYNIFTQPPSDNEVCTPVALPTNSSCPPPPVPPVCTKAVDVAVVVDMSGSVSNTQFAAITAFTLNFAAQFDFSANTGRMGLVWFGNSATAKTNGLLSDRSAFFAAANVSRPTQKQSSCLGCGLAAALQMLNANARSGVPQVMLVLSDGQSNVPQNTARGCWHWDGCKKMCVGGSAGVLPAPNWLDQVPLLRANPLLTVFGLGVVADGNLQENIMRKVASPNSYTCIGQYDRLVRSVNKIKDATCGAAQNPTTTKAPVATTSSTTKVTPAASTTTSCNKTPLPIPWCYYSFDFDFSSGSQCKDNSGNNRHGSYVGSVLSGKGLWKIGARLFGASKQYISGPSCSSLNTAFSLASWVNVSRLSSPKVTVAATAQWSLVLTPSSNQCSFIRGSKTLTWSLSGLSTSYFHLAFTVDASGSATLYKDGNSVGTKSCGGALPKHTGSLTLCHHEANAFEGTFDELFLFNTCLTKSQVGGVKDNHC